MENVSGFFYSVERWITGLRGKHVFFTWTPKAASLEVVHGLSSAAITFSPPFTETEALGQLEGKY